MVSKCKIPYATSSVLNRAGGFLAYEQVGLFSEYLNWRKKTKRYRLVFCAFSNFLFHFQIGNDFEAGFLVNIYSPRVFGLHL